MKRNILKKLLTCLTAVVLMLSLLPLNTNAQSTQPSFSIALDKTSLNVNDLLNATISGQNISNLYAYEVQLQFSTKLEFNSVVHSIKGIEVKSVEGNKLVYGLSKTGNSSEENGNIQFGSVTFKAKETGSITVELISVRVLDKSTTSDVTYPVGQTLSATVTAPSNDGGGGSGTNPGTGTNPDPGTNPTPGDSLFVIVKGKTSDGKSQTTATINKDVAIKEINENKELKDLVVKVPTQDKGEKMLFILPADAAKVLLEKNTKAKFIAETPLATYKLPVSQVNLTNLTKELGTNFSLQLSITSTDSNAIAKNNLKTASEVVDFQIFAVASDGKKMKELKYFTEYVEREIKLFKRVDGSRSTAVRLNDDGSFMPVPTIFKDNKAIIITRSNSKYAVVENNVTFKDVDNGKSWAEAYIEKLASKYILTGRTSTLYKPNEHVTRSDLAVLITRSFGLTASKQYDGRFKDVTGKEDFNKNGELMAAIEAGIIMGRADGKFYPNGKVTRSQAAIMIARALQYAGYDDSKLVKTKKITNFIDLRNVAGNTKDAIELIIQAGIMSGTSKETFAPNGFTKRDQIAKILGETLTFVEFMD